MGILHLFTLCLHTHSFLLIPEEKKEEKHKKYKVQHLFWVSSTAFYIPNIELGV